MDEILHKASEIMSSEIRYRKLNTEIAKQKSIAGYEDYVYYYCEDCLYLVKNIKTSSFMFVGAYSPYEAIETAIQIFSESEEE